MRHLLTTTLITGALIGAGCATSPQRLTAAQTAQDTSQIRAEITAQQAPVTGAITLYEAMARALKNNLDHRVAMLELDLASKDYDLSRYDLLPQVVANGSYYGRDNQPGSSSVSLLSGQQSLEPSTSTERDVFSSDLSATWNILDFGLAKIRSQQLANETLIYEERRRKAIIEIMEEVHSAYYRAVSSERLNQRLSQLEQTVETAFLQSRQQFAARRTAPMPALSYQRELNDIQAQAQRLTRELQSSHMELASLMGLSPDQAFTLQAPDSNLGQNSGPTNLAMAYADMIDIALVNRPEMRESLYAQRIGDAEVKKAVLEALPSLEGFGGLNINSNDFLFNQNWIDYGARASWNLLNVFSTPARKRKAKAGAELERQKGLATAMAVMTQVGVARAQYEGLMEAYETANNGAMVQSDILQQVEALSRASSASRQTLVREQMNAILSEARRDNIRADLAKASAHIYTALGYDPYTSDVRGDEEISVIAASLETLWTKRAQAPGQ